MKKLFLLLLVTVPFTSLSQTDSITIETNDIYAGNLNFQHTIDYGANILFDSIFVERVDVRLMMDTVPWDIFQSLELTLSDGSSTIVMNNLDDPNEWSYSSSNNTYRVRINGLSETLYTGERMQHQVSFQLQNGVVEEHYISTYTNVRHIRIEGNSGVTGYIETDSSHFLIRSTANIADVNITTISLYPNPAANEFSISGFSNGRVSVFNLQGALVKSFNENQEVFEIGDLPTGTYLVMLNNRITIETKKMIKK